MLNSRDYHAHISKVHRTPSIITDVPQYPNAHIAFTKKTVYEEDEGSHHHHHLHRHHNPEFREKVEVIEYEQANADSGTGEVVFEENVDVESEEYYPRRNKGGFDLHKWKTFRH